MTDPKDKETFVREMFSSIARWYDFLNRLLSLRRDVFWRRFAVRELLKSGGNLFLDVATGTGDCAIEIVLSGDKDKSVIGIDFSPQMIYEGRKKIEREGLSDCITLLQTNALGLPFDNNYFDGAICAFGIRNFSDVRKGIGEMRRVVKDGRRIVILEFTNPANRVLRGIYHIYFQKVLPIVGGIISGKRYAYKYLPDSVMTFPDRNEFKKIMEEENIRNVQSFPLTFGIATVYAGIK